MQAQAVSKIRRHRHDEREAESHQELAILEFTAMDNAKARILKNENVRSAHGGVMYRKLKKRTKSNGRLG